MQLLIDLYWSSPFAGESFFQVIFTLFFELYGWVIFLLLFFRYVIVPIWVDVRNVTWKKKHDFVVLAIDVPKRNEQSIKAMESVFVTILGAHKTFTWAEKYLEGQFMMAISFEIVSIEGNIQYLVHTPTKWRNIIESAIYSQFPDAEITEVEDYVNTVPSHYPNDTHKMFGVEWSFDKEDWYPIRTYVEFEDKFTETFVDPLASMLEVMSRIGKGEQIWFHILAKPSKVNWGDGAKDLIEELVTGEKPKKKPGILGSLFQGPKKIVNEFGQQVVLADLIPDPAAAEEQAKEDQFGKIWRMSPGQRERLELLERKISKLAYECKFRYGYFAELDKFDKNKGVESVIGAIKQFNAMGRNGLKPDLKTTGTKADYFFTDSRTNFRRRRITDALKRRSTTIGSKKKFVNVEELATLYHFPGMDVRIPTLRKTQVVKREAPVNLPFEEAPEAPEPQVVPTELLPTLPQPLEPGSALEEAAKEQHSQRLGQYDYDSDAFEHRFAKDKEAFEQSREQRAERLHEIADEEKDAYGYSVADRDISVEKAEDEPPVYSTPSFDYDNDEFEKRFAKDREAFLDSRDERAVRLEEIAKEEEEKTRERLKKLGVMDEGPQAEILAAHTGPHVKTNKTIIDIHEIKKSANASPETKLGDEVVPDNLPFV